MRITDMSVKEALEFFEKAGSHYSTQSDPICAIGAEEDGKLHGVAVMGKVSNGVAEICHIYSDGKQQVYTTLYGNCVRVLKALGYKMMKLDAL